MKRISLVLASTLALGSLWQSFAGPTEELTSAARKLAEQPNYSWRQTTEVAGGGNGGRGPGPVDGKVEKNGYALLSMSRGETSIQSVIKGDKGAIKIGEEWKSAEEAAADTGGGGGGWNPGRFFARTLKTFKAPAAQAESLAGKVKDLKKTDSGFSGELTEDGAKEYLSMGGRGGGDAPNIEGAKGNATFWIKDGALTKFSFKVQGKVSFNGNDRDVDRTTTIEIKDVGTTKVEVPEAALKKAY